MRRLRARAHDVPAEENPVVIRASKAAARPDRRGDLEGGEGVGDHLRLVPAPVIVWHFLKLLFGIIDV
jgi:hypothetical protein